jgi:hypothetical protein
MLLETLIEYAVPEGILLLYVFGVRTKTLEAVSPPSMLKGRHVLKLSEETWTFFVHCPSLSTVTTLGGIALLKVMVMVLVLETPVALLSGLIEAT